MDFIKNHAKAFLWSYVLLIVLTVSLCIYVTFDLEYEREGLKYPSMRYEAEMKNAAEELSSALNKNDDMTAYHNALTALEYAKRLGNTSAADLFSEIAEKIRAGDGAKYKARLDTEIKNGFKAQKADENTISAGNRVSKSEQKRNIIRAEKAANELFGLKNTLHYIGGAENPVFACENAYAVMDGEKCIPLEGCISLSKNESGRISDDDRISVCRAFLSKLLTPDELENVYIVNDSGGKTVFQVGERCVCVTLDTGSGRVVSFVVR